MMARRGRTHNNINNVLLIKLIIIAWDHLKALELELNYSPPRSGYGTILVVRLVWYHYGSKQQPSAAAMHLLC